MDFKINLGMSCFDKKKDFLGQIEADESLVNRSSKAKHANNILAKVRNAFSGLAFAPVAA